MSAEDYGHNGPLKKRIYELRGGTRETVRCEYCHVAVPEDELEKLMEYDCEQYAELAGNAKEEVNNQWD